MKEIGTSHWNSPNTGATNISGFTGLPGGSRSIDGAFYNIGDYGFWWSSTEFDTNNAFYRFLIYDDFILAESFSDKSIGISVRCLRD